MAPSCCRSTSRAASSSSKAFAELPRWRAATRAIFTRSSGRFELTLVERHEIVPSLLRAVQRLEGVDGGSIHIDVENGLVDLDRARPIVHLIGQELRAPEQEDLLLLLGLGDVHPPLEHA